MAEAIQVYEIVNSVAEQSLGMTALTPTKADFVRVGETVLATEKNKDTFFMQLYDVIGKTVEAIRVYKSKRVRALHREPFEYGAYLRKISYTMPLAQENPTWYGVSEEPASLQEKTDVDIRQKIFRGFSTWEVPLTKPDIQLKSAFTDAVSMAAFISGMFINMDNAMELAYENLGNITTASFIAAIVNSKKVNCAINLLSEYNSLFGTSITVPDCLYNPEFLRYAAQRMKEVSDNLSVMSVTFNIEEQERFTSPDNQVFEVLGKFKSAIDMYLQSDVFHNELTKLPNFYTVPYWQGSGTNWDFASVSSVDLTVESASGTPESLQASGVVAVIRDKDALGTTIDNRRTKSFYDPHNEYTNYWEKAELGYYRDMSENGVVFYVA